MWHKNLRSKEKDVITYIYIIPSTNSSNLTPVIASSLSFKKAFPHSRKAFPHSSIP